MKRTIPTAIVLALVIGLLVIAPVAFANSSSNRAWAPFGKANWVKGVGNPGYGLVTTSDSTHPYGGIQLKKSFTPKDPNAITNLSFDFNPNQTGGSGGSPRMVVQFSDGGNADLRPLNWIANTWTHLDGMTGNNWDNSGGSCGSLYATTWTIVLTCHSGTTITAIFVVNDSGWLYPNTGEQVTLDNITVNNLTATGPANHD